MGKESRYLLRDSCVALASARDGKVNLSEFGRKTKISQGGAQRVLGATSHATLSTVDAIASAYGLEPWQLIAPGFSIKHPPKMLDAASRLTEQEAALIDQFRALPEERRADLLALARLWSGAK